MMRYSPLVLLQQKLINPCSLGSDHNIPFTSWSTLDDILITRNNPHTITNLIKDINKEFALKDLGELNYFLVKQVTSFPNGKIHLSQRKYIQDLLIRTKVQYAKGTNTPMTSGHKLTAYGSDPTQNIQLYRSVVGA